MIVLQAVLALRVLKKEESLGKVQLHCFCLLSNLKGISPHQKQSSHFPALSSSVAESVCGRLPRCLESRVVSWRQMALILHLFHHACLSQSIHISSDGELLHTSDVTGTEACTTLGNKLGKGKLWRNSAVFPAFGEFWRLAKFWLLLAFICLLLLAPDICDNWLVFL